MAGKPQWILGRAKQRQSMQSASVRLLAEKPGTWSELSDAVVVRWRFPSQGTAEEALSEVERFEDSLRPLWNTASSCLVVVLTYADCREFVVYAANAKAFLQQLNAVLGDVREYPVILDHETDPSWNRWEQFAALRK